MSEQLDQSKDWIRVRRSADDTHLLGDNGQRFEFSDVPADWWSGKETNGWIQTQGKKQGLFVSVIAAENIRRKEVAMNGT